MDHVISLKCLICGQEHAPDEVLYVCPRHGDEGIVDVRYDYGLIGRRVDPQRLAADPDPSIWRYLDLLPVDAGRFRAWRASYGEGELAYPIFHVGGTPLYAPPRLREVLHLPHLWVKDDGRLPSASFKDRASALAVVKARELGRQVIAAASTGNAASSLANLTAASDFRTIIFVPAAAPPAKIAQLLVFGSTVLAVRGTYDDAFELCLKATKAYGWYSRNTAHNPYMSEGKKTAAYEICEQLGWSAPDRIFVSVGDGCIIGGLHKGLKDLLALGWIDRMPRLMGVQAAGSSAMYAAWQAGLAPLEMTPIAAHTVADSISAGLPRDRIKAMAAVRETDGAYVQVSDEEILAAIPALGRGCGVFAEPAGAASYAGLLKALDQGLLDRDERVVVLVTGNGLKDVASARKAVGEPFIIEPTMEEVERIRSQDPGLTDR
jgi:threonine synthase